MCHPLTEQSREEAPKSTSGENPCHCRKWYIMTAAVGHCLKLTLFGSSLPKCCQTFEVFSWCCAPLEANGMVCAVLKERNWLDSALVIRQSGYLKTTLWTIYWKKNITQQIASRKLSQFPKPRNEPLYRLQAIEEPSGSTYWPPLSSKWKVPLLHFPRHSDMTGKVD